MSTSKHIRSTTTDDRDLKRNPGIGASKGTTIAGVDPDELEDLEGSVTFEGDVENETNRLGGIDPDHRGRKNK